MKLNKMKLLTLYFLLISVFFSCSDDNTIVTKKETTPQIKDSSIFDWEYIHFYQWNFYGMYVADTDKIFIAADPGSVLFNGKEFRQIDENSWDFQPSAVSGFDANNVYFGGHDRDFIHSKLRKWNGSSIEEIQMPNDSSRGIWNILMISPNNMWLASASNKIYHYNGVNFEPFVLPVAALFDQDFFVSSPGNLYLFDVAMGYDSDTFRTFKYDGSSWDLFLSDIVTANSELRLFHRVCGEDFIRGGANYVYYFTGSGWNPIAETPGFRGRRFAGSSRKEFICMGYNENAIPYNEVYYYNGIEWLHQNNYSPPWSYRDQVGAPFFKGGVNYYGILPKAPFDALITVARPKRTDGQENETWKEKANQGNNDNNMEKSKTLERR